MESSFIKSDDTKILLSSCLKENSFGRTDLVNFLKEKGTLASCKVDGEFKYNDWNFEKTVVRDDGTVLFEGNCFSSQSLISLLLKNRNERTPLENKKIIYVFKVLDHIIQNGIFCEEADATEKTFIPGPEGIFISNDSDDNLKILVLPGNLFERCAQNSSSYDKIQGIFVHRGLESFENALFTRGVMAYMAVCSKQPFNQMNFEKRQADFTDENFTPLEYMVKNVQEDLYIAIDSALKLKRKKPVIKGEKRFINEKYENQRQLYLKKAQSFSFSLLQDFFTSKSTLENDEDDMDFKRKRLRFEEKLSAKLKIKRFLNRNSKSIKITLICILAGIYGLNSFHKTNQKLATSLGLTSIQTVQTLFTGIHTADVTIIQEISKGKETKSLIQSVAGFYVTNKQRAAVDEKNGTLSPSQWLFFKGKTDFWQYGITNLKIDDESYPPVFKYPRRMDKKIPLVKDGEKSLKKGDTKIHRVEYNFIHNDGDNVISVNKAVEDVTLVWNGKRWLVKSIRGKQKPSSYKTKEYKQDYINALETSGGSIKTASGKLRSKYFFVPAENEIRAEIPGMIKKFNSTAAKEFDR